MDVECVVVRFIEWLKFSVVQVKCDVQEVDNRLVGCCRHL